MKIMTIFICGLFSLLASLFTWCSPANASLSTCPADFLDPPIVRTPVSAIPAIKEWAKRVDNNSVVKIALASEYQDYKYFKLGNYSCYYPGTHETTGRGGFLPKGYRFGYLALVTFKNERFSGGTGLMLTFGYSKNGWKVLP